jgi:hypothetical protein
MNGASTRRCISDLLRWNRHRVICRNVLKRLFGPANPRRMR